MLRAGKFHNTISNSSCIYQPRSLTYWGQPNATRPSATSLASVKWDHLLPEGSQMPQGHQQQLLNPSTGITYSLRAGRCHKAVSNSPCTYQLGSLTSWGQADATRPSATALTSINQDHLLSKGRQMPQGHQQQPLQLSTRITYKLRAGKCHKAISNSFCIYESGSLTYWQQANATRLSATALASIKWDHLLPEGSQMRQGHQQQLLHLSNGITYLLRAVKCHKAISNSSCMYQLGSLTFWVQADATRPSATALASINQDSLHTGDRQMPQGHQQQLLHLSNGSLTPWGQPNATRPSATAYGPINWDYLLPEGRQMPQGHQQQLLHLSTRITYILRTAKCHKAISNSSCSYQPGSLTNWGQANATRPSATALAPINWDHLLPEGSQIPQGHQQQLMDLSTGITYFLRAGRGHQAISNSSCTYQLGSLTSWEQADATRPSTTALAHINWDHLHPESRQMPQGHQQQLLHLSTRITYILRTGKCHKAISNSSCIYQMGSLTLWRQANTTKPSATALASIKWDHLLSEGRQMQQGCQQQLLHLWIRITYKLRTGKCHKAICNSSCIYESRALTCWGQANATRLSATALASINWDHLLSEGSKMPQGHQQQLLHLSTGITYSLRAGQCHKAISNSSCIYQLGLLTCWGQANTTRLSATALAPINWDHLQTEGRKMPDSHQQQLFHLLSKITYLLRAGKCHKAISNSSCTYQPGSHTSWGRQMSPGHRWQLLQLSSSITYNLKAKRVYVSYSADLNILRIHDTPADIIECGNTVSRCCAIIQDNPYILNSSKLTITVKICLSDSIYMHSP